MILFEIIKIKHTMHVWLTKKSYHLLLKYCDLIDQVLGEFCSESAVPLVDLYSIASLCLKDKEELDRIYKGLRKWS